MPFKLNISEKDKSWKLEIESDFLIGKRLGEKIDGREISKELEGYELEISGASDKSGFPNKKDIEGAELRKVLLTKGWGMHKKPKKEGKKKVKTPKGLRLRKTVRGNQISEKTVQINISVLKAGKRKLEEIFPEQNKSKVVEKKAEEKVEIKEEAKEEQKVEISVPTHTLLP